MSDRRFGPVLSLLRQGISVEREFGTHSLEALLSVAELVEESVYERGSLMRVPSGITFRMNNPPLRTGAFSALRIAVDGQWVSAHGARVRHGAGASWRPLSEISREAPLELRPGESAEFSVDVSIPPRTPRLTVRLELQSTTIPPLVWFEFRDALLIADRP